MQIWEEADGFIKGDILIFHYMFKRLTFKPYNIFQWEIIHYGWCESDYIHPTISSLHIRLKSSLVTSRDLPVLASWILVDLQRNENGLNWVWN